MSVTRKFTLTAEQTGELIENVRKFPCLWNPEHEEYTYRSAVAIAWNQIAKRMALREKMLRAKWKNLRDLFVRESKRLNVNSIDEYHGKWRHYRNLYFLFRPNSGERGRSGDDSSRESLDAGREEEQVVVKIEPATDDTSEFMFLDPEQDMHEIDSRKRHYPTDSGGGENPFLAPKRLSVNQYSDDDCDMMFLMSLAPYFRQLRPARKLAVRSKIQELLLKELERNGVNGQL